MRWRLLTAAALCCAPMSASGQLIEVGVTGGATYWDSKDFGDIYGVNLGVELALIDWFVVEGRTGYYQGERFDLEVVPLEVAGIFRLSILDTIEPYGGLGVGQYFISVSDIEANDRQALFPLAGIDVHLPTTNLTLTAEARWMFFSDSVTDEVDSDLDGVAISLGVMWSF
ncbi:MAG: outer membrane beta-barrel protein [Phycisphaerales bacterium JB039]